MASYKVLGQVNPTNTSVSATLYTVPNSTQTFCSTLSICNQGLTTSNVRVAVQPSGAPLDTKHYIVYNQTIYPSDSLFLTIGIALSQTDLVSVQATTSSVSFNLFGSEI
jgi:hypothetical protein